MAFLATFSTIIVGLRLWTRTFIRQLGIDDWAALVTLRRGLFTNYSFRLLVVRYGLGKHVWTLPLEDRILYQRSFWVTSVFYINALAAAKLTFLFQYRRVLGVSRMRNVYNALIALIVIWAIAGDVFLCFSCIPLEGFWDPRVKVKCVPNAHYGWVFSALFNILTDIIIFILPIPIIRKLKLPVSQKAFLIGIFSIGFLTVAISCVRMKYLNNRPDTTWENLDQALWSLAELTSAITCACLATLRPLVTRFRKWWSGAGEERSNVIQMTSAANNSNDAGNAQKSPPPTATTLTSTRTDDDVTNSESTASPSRWSDTTHASRAVHPGMITDRREPAEHKSK
ncbi:integral membrane [Colletotrichum sojae]|uniref:Integral membrane n=1 Tax=Colletotrichum sojae TaxID=2175907 RepID=A0A8H6MU42_9PEZI|nr:integral membrane [Colletotrichum sojae]